MNQSRAGFWDSSDCALLLVDYQDSVLDLIFEQDRRIIELNARILAKFASAINIPVIHEHSRCRNGRQQADASLDPGCSSKR